MKNPYTGPGPRWTFIGGIAGAVIGLILVIILAKTGVWAR